MQNFNFIEKLTENVSTKTNKNVTKKEIIEMLFEIFMNTIFFVCWIVVFVLVVYGVCVALF